MLDPLPTTVLINPDGKVEKIITGEMTEADIVHIWQLLNRNKEFLRMEKITCECGHVIPKVHNYVKNVGDPNRRRQNTKNCRYAV